jgi:uncharacterized protein with FMN-binding domain
MRRAPIILSATVAGTAAVLGFHTHPAVSPAAVATATTRASGTSSTASTATTAKTATTSSSSGTKTATGAAMQTRYGPAQVRVTVTSGKITKIEAVQLQNGDPKSQAISSSAAPILQQSALSKQTAAVNAVSGATYTSASYEGSLQSALDKVGFKAANGSVASTDMSQLQ